MSPIIFGFASLTQYPEWMARQDFMRQMLEYLVDALKYLQWQGYGSETKPWILKAPYYYGFEPVINEVFPGARFIMTHRHPLKTIPSVCSLLKAWTLPVSPTNLNLPPFVASNAAQINAHIENRKNHPELSLIDIYFKDLIGDIKPVVRRIYDYLDMPLSDEEINELFTSYIELLEQLFPDK